MTKNQTRSLNSLVKNLLRTLVKKIVKNQTRSLKSLVKHLARTPARKMAKNPSAMTETVKMKVQQSIRKRLTTPLSRETRQLESSTAQKRTTIIFLA